MPGSLIRLLPGRGDLQVQPGEQQAGNVTGDTMLSGLKGVPESHEESDMSIYRNRVIMTDFHLQLHSALSAGPFLQEAVACLAEVVVKGRKGSSCTDKPVVLCYICCPCN